MTTGRDRAHRRLGRLAAETKNIHPALESGFRALVDRGKTPIPREKVESPIRRN